VIVRMDGLEDGHGGFVRVAVPAGGHARVEVADPGAFVRRVAGVLPGPGDVALDATVLTEATAAQRWRAGLATVMSELPDDIGQTVLDVVLLGTVLPGRFRAAAVAVGTRRARAQLADAEAAARSLSGRIGLSRWLDMPVDATPAGVRATADLARALMAGPRALVWRHPHWLRPAQIQALSEVVDSERRRLALAVVEVRLM
jgi:ABC-type branched-subunit amino acid transport system ATPase component